MDITTKFNVGDRVFLLYDNLVTETQIHTIHVNVISNGGAIHPIPVIDIKYDIELKKTRCLWVEPLLFATKEDLLKSL